MTDPIEVRLGRPGDVRAALSVYERSNLARRKGVWPARSARLEHVRRNLEDPASWFLVGYTPDEVVAMALVLPFRAEQGAGPIIPDTSFLDLIYVVPDRWGEGIGGALLDAVIYEAARRGSLRMYLWTHERENERAQRLYRSRGFRRTGRTAHNDAHEPTAEWVRAVD